MVIEVEIFKFVNGINLNEYIESGVWEIIWIDVKVSKEFVEFKVIFLIYIKRKFFYYVINIIILIFFLGMFIILVFVLFVDVGEKMLYVMIVFLFFVVFLIIINILFLVSLEIIFVFSIYFFM